MLARRKTKALIYVHWRWFEEVNCFLTIISVGVTCGQKFCRVSNLPTNTLVPASAPEKKGAAAFCANCQRRPDEKVISWLSWWGQKDILAMLDSWGFDRCQWPHKRWAASNTRSFHLQLRSSFPWLVGLMYLLNILRTRSSAVMRRTSWG